MKRRKYVKRFALIFTVILMISGLSQADAPTDGMITLATDSGAFKISSTTVSPTQILTRQPYIQRTYIINTSTFTLLFSTFSHTMSQTTDINIPASTVFSPDGPTVPYWGPGFAVIVGTSSSASGNFISVFRAK